MVTRACQLVVALCLVVGAFGQGQSNNVNRNNDAIQANVVFLQQQGLSLEEARLLSDSAAIEGGEIPILEDVRDGPWHDGSYYFRYTSADGSTREEGGIPTAPCTMRVTGSYSYIAPNAELIDMQYLADENGYRAFRSGTRPDLYTAPVRVPEPIYPVGYFDGIPCPGDEFNPGGVNQGRPSANGGGTRPSPTRGGARPRPTTGTQGIPTTGNQVRPRPTTGNQVRPRPTTGGSPVRPINGNNRPVTPPRPIPGTGGQRPINGGSQVRPINGGSQVRPINGGQRPTTTNGFGNNGFGQRPTTINGFGQRPTPSAGGFGDRQTTPDAGFKTPTSFITSPSTNVNVQNNFNGGQPTTNNGYAYTEPPTPFNPVATEFPGQQTTAIEPLTQLYDSPNY